MYEADFEEEVGNEADDACVGEDTDVREEVIEDTDVREEMIEDTDGYADVEVDENAIEGEDKVEASGNRPLSAESSQARSGEQEEHLAAARDMEQPDHAEEGVSCAGRSFFGVEVTRELVEGFLHFHGLHATLRCLEQELPLMQEQSLLLEQSSASWKERVRERMLRDFDDGEFNRFWNFWEKCVPQKLVRSHPSTRKLELDLHVHFAAQHLHAHTASRRGWLAAGEGPLPALQQYVEGRGRDTVAELNCAHVCALPVLKTPWQSRELGMYFESAWIETTRTSLSSFLKTSLRAPLLPKIYRMSSMPPAAAARMEEPTTERMRTLLEEVKRRVEAMQGVSAAMHETVSRDLLNVVSLALQSDFAQAPAISSTEDAARRSAALLRLDGAREVPMSLEAVGATLRGREDRLKARLLQALRWRILRRTRRGQREVVLEYARADLLRLREGTQTLESCLRSSDALLRQQTARFLDILASFSAGRAYLLQMEAAGVQLVLEALQLPANQGPTMLHLLGFTQKCSRRRLVRDEAERKRLLDWCLDLLLLPDRLPDSLARYACGFLLNLAQTAQGRAALALRRKLVLRILVDLLEHEDPAVREYVHGLLYASLKDPLLLEEAETLGLQEILLALLELNRTQGYLRLSSQIQLILLRLRRDDVMRGAEDVDVESEQSEQEDETESEEASRFLFAETREDADDVLPASEEGEGAEFLFLRFRTSAAVQEALLLPSRTEERVAAPSAREDEAEEYLAKGRILTPPARKQQEEVKQEEVKQLEDETSAARGQEDGARRIRTPTQDNLDKIQQRAREKNPSLQNISVEEYRTAFEGRFKVPRTPPHA